MLSTFTVHAIGFNQYSSNKKGVWHDVKFMEIFYYSPKKAESLRELQTVLKLPELKIVKPSSTRWLSHEQCVIAKCIYAMYAFMYAIKSIYKCCINGCKPHCLGKIQASSRALMYIQCLQIRCLVLTGLELELQTPV